MRQIRATYAADRPRRRRAGSRRRATRGRGSARCSAPSKVAERRAAHPGARPHAVTPDGHAIAAPTSDDGGRRRRRPAPRRRRGARRRERRSPLGVVVARRSPSLAIALHRNGHTPGRRLRAVPAPGPQHLRRRHRPRSSPTTASRCSTPAAAFSPIAYPWGLPLLLSPFVHLWGLDYDRLKLVEVACFCVVARARPRHRAPAGRAPASPSPSPPSRHRAGAARRTPTSCCRSTRTRSSSPSFIWWLDRVHAAPPACIAAPTPPARHARRARGGRLQRPPRERRAPRRHRRDAVRRRARRAQPRRRRGRPSPWRRGRNPLGALPWKTLSIPYLSFAAGCAIAQFLLPSTLVPDNGNSRRFITPGCSTSTSPGSCPNPRNLSAGAEELRQLPVAPAATARAHGAAGVRLIIICLASPAR